MEASHAAWLLLAILTHAVVGYTLVRLFTSAPAASGALGGVVPDLDLGVLLGGPLPIAHRGVTHTPVFVLALGGIALLVGRRRVAAGLVLGGFSHLAIDSFTKTGIQWFYPVGDHYGVSAGVHAVQYDVLVWLLCAALLVRRRRARRARSEFTRETR